MRSHPRWSASAPRTCASRCSSWVNIGMRARMAAISLACPPPIRFANRDSRGWSCCQNLIRSSKKNGGLYRRAAEVADRLLPVRAAFAARRQEGHDEPAVAFAEPDVHVGATMGLAKTYCGPHNTTRRQPLPRLVIRVWPVRSQPVHFFHPYRYPLPPRTAGATWQAQEGPGSHSWAESRTVYHG